MYIIAGLGNPGSKYEKTRHNVGFDVIDAIGGKYNIPVMELKHKAMNGRGYIEGEKVILLKPLTFMNESGESIRQAVDYYKVDPGEGLIVISDDISLVPGQLRVRKKGSAGGHNGLKNIIGLLGREDFKRVRIGVGEKPAGYDLATWVLSRFDKEDRKAVDGAVLKAVEAVEMILSEGADAAMNRFNNRLSISPLKGVPVQK